MTDGNSTTSTMVLPTPAECRVLLDALAGCCTACGISGSKVDLITVPGDHLTFFAGQEVCFDCAPHHGIL